jgi:hypothetical protein
MMNPIGPAPAADGATNSPEVDRFVEDKRTQLS